MDSSRVRYPLGSLSSIQAKTFGEPGHRTFHLALEAGLANCVVWLEKEQLFQLGIHLQEVVQRLSSEDREGGSRPAQEAWSGGQLSLDFKAGQMSLEYVIETNSLELTAYEIEDPESDDTSREGSSVSFCITIDQAGDLAEEALRICAAGRPRCFLCGLPINPEGHVCPRSNGHTAFETG